MLSESSQHARNFSQAFSNIPAPVDDSTQKQILQLKKEKGELSKDNAVMAQKLEFLQLQCEEEQAQSRRLKEKNDALVQSLR